MNRVEAIWETALNRAKTLYEKQQIVDYIRENPDEAFDLIIEQMKMIDNLKRRNQMNNALAQYIADYINEELDRHEEITMDTIKSAYDSFQGGAR